MNAGEPLSTRAVRMKNYNELIQLARFRRRALFAGNQRSGSHRYRGREGDDRRSTGEVLVHLGNGNYLQRYRIYVTHVKPGASSSTNSIRWTCAMTARSS